MSEAIASAELLTFFKALADANRLKIVGLLAGQPSTVEDLAVALKLSPSTVSHHLARLGEAGLVSARARGRYSVYQLEVAALEDRARRLLARPDLPAVAPEADVDAFERAVLNNFLGPDGRIKDLPAQQKKLLVILQHVAQAFEPGVRYTEKQVKAILSRFYDDTTTVRRLLVDFHLVARESGIYWKVEE
jgi:hypothetical protein